MTCVVGYIDKKNHRTYLAADSCVTDFWTAWKLKRGDKIITRTGCVKGGAIMFGIAGEDRISNVLRHDLVLPDHTSRKMTAEKYINGPFLAALRKACKDAGFSKIHHNEETIDSHMLIAYHNKLYVIYEGFAVDEMDSPYHAIGCGYSFAFGALAAMEGTSLTPKVRAKKAVLAACRYDPFVDEPVVLRELTWS